MTTHTITSEPLTRPVEGRLLGGVAAGVADHFDLDVTLVRLVLAVLAIMGGAGIPLYAAAFLLIPEEGSDRSVLADLLSSARSSRDDVDGSD